MEGFPIIDRSTIANDWHARGFSCGMWIDHAGREWREESRETEELFMAISGELELEINGERIQPSLGEEVYISSGLPYIIRNIGGTTARWLYGQKLKPSAPLHTIEPVCEFMHSPQ
jgi:hypothetical protein